MNIVDQAILTESLGLLFEDHELLMQYVRKLATSSNKKEREVADVLKKLSVALKKGDFGKVEALTTMVDLNLLKSVVQRKKKKKMIA